LRVANNHSIMSQDLEPAGIITYGAGNIFSLCSALDRLRLPYRMITVPSEFEGCARYIIPGVGHAGQAMNKLAQSGFVPLIKSCLKPVLGICVGMQLLTVSSEEGQSTLTGIVPLHTKLFRQQDGSKVPHMGWNEVEAQSGDPLFAGLEGKRHFYFVHSYFIEFNSNFTIGTTMYGQKFSSALKKDNYRGVQFHPEKSGHNGERLLNNFYTLNS